MMTLLNGAADLSNTSLLYIHRSDKPDHAYPTTSRNGLHELAEYMHSATLSGVARDTVATAWTLVAPQWLQHQNRIRALERGMKEAPSLQVYEECATELDHLQGHDQWKHTLESIEEEYNPKIIKKQMRALQKAVQTSDIGRLQYLLRTQLSRTLGGMDLLRLYKHSWHGTKQLVTDYIDTVISSIQSLLELTEKARLPALESRFHQKSLEDALRYFGRSALTLSGGAKLGMKHIGVIRALWQANLLPNIISGASAGAIVAAVVGAHADSEMEEVLERFLASDMAVFDPPEVQGPIRWCASRCRTAVRIHAWFDVNNLAEIMKKWLGKMTFKEARNKTGRIINICVSSADSSEPRLLNYMTAPNVFLWSAVCASCSVPYVFQPATIYERNIRTGKTEVWMESSQQWVDGSLDSDIPQRKLSEMFNVNFFVVSQVNPHVRPFLAAEEEFRGVQPTTAKAEEDTLVRRAATLAKDDLVHRADIFSRAPCMTPVVRGISVLTQKYTGDINILPEIAPSEYLHMMSNPTIENILEATRSGERATWPKMSRLRNSVAIELALLQAIHVFRDRVNFGPAAARARQRLRLEVHRGRSHMSRSRRSSSRRRRSLSNEGSQWDMLLTSSLNPPPPSPNRAVKRNSSAGSLVEKLGMTTTRMTPMEPPKTLPTLAPQAGVSHSMTVSDTNNDIHRDGFALRGDDESDLEYFGAAQEDRASSGLETPPIPHVTLTPCTSETSSPVEDFKVFL